MSTSLRIIRKSHFTIASIVLKSNGSNAVYRAEKETAALGAALFRMLREDAGIADEVSEKCWKWDICIKSTTVEAEMKRDD